MLPELEPYTSWLKRRFPGSETCWHYPNDLKLIGAWLGKPVCEMRVRDVDNYIEHALRLRHKPNTIKRRLAGLTSYFEFLMLTQPDAPKCPVIERRHKMKQAERLPRDVSDAVVNQFFSVVKRERDRAMFSLMYACGLRLGEVRNLKLSGLHLQPSSQNVLPRLTFVGKGNKERSVFVANLALGPLKAWLSMRPVAADDAVFLTRASTHYSTTNIRRLLDRYCKRAGVKFTCHQLRHAFARLLAERGVPVTTIQQLLGHKHVETTQIYIKVSDPIAMAFYDTAMQQVVAKVPFLALQGLQGGGT